MADFDLLRRLIVPAESKIVFLVMDGLGGLPREPGGKSELEIARIPNLDALAASGMTGLSHPVARGITPGSGPSHLALFGYDPIRFDIGRGVLEALGIDFDMTPDDVAARGNFCTVDAEGHITDRRAGRIPTETCVALTKALGEIRIPGVELFVRPVKEHRFVLVLRGRDLDDRLGETDPQRPGAAPIPVKAKSADAESTARLVNDWVAKAREVLKDKHPANHLLLRGFAKRPDLPQMREVYGLRAAAIAIYPMYRGLAKLVGMEIVPAGDTLASEFDTLAARFRDFDFFYLHVKGTDSAGEDGDFDRKVRVLEEVDGLLPGLTRLAPDVIVVSGDHSTPAVMKAHSWHPVPTILASRLGYNGPVAKFSERACAQGTLGQLPATDLMPLALAHAGRLAKYGA